jgi:hypothetical protein
MLRSKRLDDEAVAKFKAPAKRITLPDPELRGHYIRVTPSGSKSFWAVARDPSGKQHWQLIGQADSMNIEDARDKARKVMRAIRAAIRGEVIADSSFEGVALEAPYGETGAALPKESWCIPSQIYHSCFRWDGVCGRAPQTHYHPFRPNRG